MGARGISRGCVVPVGRTHDMGGYPLAPQCARKAWQRRKSDEMRQDGNS